MSDPTLIDSAPDLLLLVRRDGTVVAHAGGDAVAELGGGRGAAAFEPAWTESTATLIRQLARKAIAGRAVVEARFDEYARTYEVRATPQGPDRAICSIRPVLESRAPGPGLDATGEHPVGHLDRRGFLRRFQESTSMAALRESPLAVALIYVDGIVDVAQVIAFTDDDTMPDSRWLGVALEALDADPGAGAASGGLVMPLPADPTDYEIDAARHADSPFVTANCFCRKEVLEAVGGFGERFEIAWREDSDLHFRLLEHGARVCGCC